MPAPWCRKVWRGAGRRPRRPDARGSRPVGRTGLPCGVQLQHRSGHKPHVRPDGPPARSAGFGTAFVAAIRDRGMPTGLLLVAGPEAGIMAQEAVQALELLSVLAGVTLARIGG